MPPATLFSSRLTANSKQQTANSNSGGDERRQIIDHRDVAMLRASIKHKDMETRRQAANIVAL
jgi:hypothetical protein